MARDEFLSGNRPTPMSTQPMPQTAAEHKARIAAFAKAARKSGMPDVADQYDVQNGADHDSRVKSRERTA